jgi:hypothetical protein
MQNKTLIKLIIDIVSTVVFIILINPRETGFTFHEIAGLSIGALFITHILLNWTWVKNVTKNLFNPKVKIKTKLFYLLNSISFISVAAIIITGIQISEVLFPAQGVISHNTVLLHKWLSYGCLVLFGLHILLHWRFFTHTVPCALKASGHLAFGKLTLNLATIVLVLGFLYSQIMLGDTSKAKQTVQQASTSSSDVIYENRHKSNNDRLQSGSSSSSNAKSNNQTPSISTPTKRSGSSNISSGSGSTSTQMTLSQYLGNLFCTGCDKHCSLLNPRCDRGIPQQEAATQKYQAIYSTDTVK